MGYKIIDTKCYRSFSHTSMRTKHEEDPLQNDILAKNENRIKKLTTKRNMKKNRYTRTERRRRCRRQNQIKYQCIIFRLSSHNVKCLEHTTDIKFRTQNFR